MQTTETIYTYAPIGDDRPEPYPDGFVPDASRWSGREYARIALKGPGLVELTAADWTVAPGSSACAS